MWENDFAITIESPASKFTSSNKINIELNNNSKLLRKQMRDNSQGTSASSIWS